MMMASAARPARGGDVLADWAQSLPGQAGGESEQSWYAIGKVGWFTPRRLLKKIVSSCDASR